MTSVSELRRGTKKTPMKEVMALPPKQRIAVLLKENEKEIMAALPKHVTKERMLVIAQTAATSVPGLVECYTPSLFGALIKCTQLGLEPNNPLGHCYLIPFRNNKKNRMDVQMMIGYRGMIDLARRSGHVVSINAQAVFEGDEFEYEFGLEEKLRHIPGSDRGECTHYYAYAKLTGGGHQFDVRTADDMRQLMLSTQSKGEYGPWKSSPIPMGRKSMIRALFNYLPVSIEMATARAIDGQAEAGVDQGLGAVLAGDYTVMEDDDAPQIGAPEPEPEPEPEPVVDVNGEIFDPEKHAAMEGEPVYNKDKSFRKKPQRRAKPPAQAAPPADEPPPDDNDDVNTDVQGDDAPPDDSGFYEGDEAGDDDGFNLE